MVTADDRPASEARVVNDSIEFYNATEKVQAEDVDPETHNSARCNLGAGICPVCSTEV